MIYLDNSATTRPNEACVAAMNELLTECWFNPSSVYRPGMDAAHRLKTARAQVAQALGADGELIRNIILFSVLIYELVGPLATKESLKAAGAITEKPREVLERRERKLAEAEPKEFLERRKERANKK